MATRKITQCLLFFLCGLLINLPRSLQTVGAFSPSPPYPDTLTWSPDGTKIAVSGDRFLTVRDAVDGKLLLDLPIGDTLVLNHAWSPDSTRLVSASADEFIRVWNIYDSGHVPGELLASIKATSNTGFLSFVDWKPDGQLIAAAITFGGGGLYLWDANSYQMMGSIGMGWTNIITWNPDPIKNQIARAGDEEGPKIVTLNDPPTLSSDPIGGRDVVARTFAWNSDGTQLAVAYEDGETYVWDIETDTQVALLSAHDGIVVRSLAWSPDDQTIVTASGDGFIRLWDSTTGELLQASAKLTGIVVDFSPDGTKIAYTISSHDVSIVTVDSIGSLSPLDTTDEPTGTAEGA